MGKFNGLALTISIILLLACLGAGDEESEEYFPPKSETINVSMADKQKLISFCRSHSEFPNSCDYFEYKVLGSYDLSTSGFYIDKYPVSTKKFLEYCKKTICDPVIEKWVSGEMRKGDGNHPVTGVTWKEAKEYCGFYGKRLPSREEYEIVTYKDEIFPWSDYPALVDPPNKEGNKKSATITIGSNPKDVGNKGVSDVYSNCPEWTGTDNCERRYKIPGIKIMGDCTPGQFAIFKGNCYYVDLMGLFIFFRKISTGR